MIPFRKQLFFLWALLAAGGWTVAAMPVDTTVTFRVHYYVDRYELAPELMMNAATLREMDTLVDSLQQAHARFQLQVVSGASPEGTEEKNRTLAENRTIRLRTYLLQRHPTLSSTDISTLSLGADWEGLVTVVQKSRYDWRDEVLYIIRNTPVWVKGRSGAVVDSRKKQLMDLRGGQPWREMVREIFPYLRRTRVNVSWDLDKAPAQPQRDTVYIHDRDTITVEKRMLVPAPGHKHGFLLYTNLAYDVAGTPSIGTEFYMGKGWALNARWSGGWWSSRPKNRFYRLYGAELALRKYFRLPSDNGAGMFRSSTGHHLGAYGQLLTYDFEFSGKGYMGGMPEKNLFAAPTWSAGLEYGYTFAIGEHLNLDLSLGVGYLQGPQWMYDPASGDGTYPLTGFRTFRWIGPTRADVSLYWLIGFENKRR